MNSQDLSKTSSTSNKKWKIQHFIGALLGVGFIFAIGFVIRNRFVNGNRILGQMPAQSDDPLSVAKCGYDAEIHYWDLTSESKNILELKEFGEKKNNLFILCDPVGSGAFTDASVFENNKLIFKKEGIYHGKVFFDEENALNIFKGVQAEGDPNCCPSRYELTKYKYDLKSENMELTETKIYSAEEFENLNIE